PDAGSGHIQVIHALAFKVAVLSPNNARNLQRSVGAAPTLVQLAKPSPKLHRPRAEARDTPVTLATATVQSLDTKTESRLKSESLFKNVRTKSNSRTKTDSQTKTVESRTKIDSKSKENTKSKTDSQSKPEAFVSDYANQVEDEPTKKSDSKSKTKTESKTKSESANKVETTAGKAATKTSTTHSKSDSGSKEDVGGTAKRPGNASELGNQADHTGTSAEEQQEATEVQQPNEVPQSRTNKTETTSKPESSNNVEVTGFGSGGRRESATASAVGTGLRRASASSSAALDARRGSAGNSRRSSAELAAENPESSHNQESPASAMEKPNDQSAPEEATPEQQGVPTASPESAGATSETKSPMKKTSRAGTSGRSVMIPDDVNPNILPTKNNPLYNTTAALDKLDKFPTLKMRRDGKYYLKMKDIVIERHPKVKRNKRGDVIPTIKKEKMGAIERVVSRFCEDVLCISRAQFLPLTSQGERHVVWVGKKKANHIIRYLNGNGCYVVNRFPGDIFVKDKQVMGIILRDHMLMRSNHCYWKCGVPKEDILNPKMPNEDEEENPITYRICRHMVKTMHMDEEGCEDKGCYNFEKHTCKHLDVFIPEVQSFCTYNALQDFSNRLDDDLKGQTFVCKPAYLYKGYGFRFFRTAAEFQEFYHMTEGKETSRHDFMVQRLVDKPFLFNGKKLDIRAFLLVVVLRYRRVISFIHYGFCRVASTEFEINEEEEELNIEEPMTDKEMEKKKAENYEKDMKMFVCTYRTAEEKVERARRIDTQTFYEEADDRSQELQAVFQKEEELQGVKEQIKHIGLRISQAIENKVWDAFGCFQIFGLDLCVDEDMKVWLIEINSHAMSDVDTLSPTQRKVVPAVIMESLGLVVETTYKSFHHLRLRKSPTNEFEETGFLFRQNYDFIFSTLAKKRMDYVWPKPPKKPDPPFYERIGVVDQQIKNVDRRKKACLAMKIAVREEQLALKRKRNAKDEEES
uniref:Doublecortin domain-containing protein n=1 Tax=Macrostomum lignano TaxID=282301 RepID=A0A1I8IQX2_9PLAT